MEFYSIKFYTNFKGNSCQCTNYCEKQSFVESVCSVLALKTYGTLIFIKVLFLATTFHYFPYFFPLCISAVNSYLLATHWNFAISTLVMLLTLSQYPHRLAEDVCVTEVDSKGDLKLAEEPAGNKRAVNDDIKSSRRQVTSGVPQKPGL